MDGIQRAWQSAWRFAALAHQGQKVPGAEGLPYLWHLGAVGMEVLAAHAESPFTNPVLAVQCALLHDTLEDTQAQADQILGAFGPAVLAGVQALTKNAELPKSEAMGDSLKRIVAQPREVWAVKLADRITNLQPPPSHWTPEKIASYRDEARAIHAALKDGHPTLVTRLARQIEAYPTSW